MIRGLRVARIAVLVLVIVVLILKFSSNVSGKSVADYASGLTSGSNAAAAPASGAADTTVNSNANNHVVDKQQSGGNSLVTAPKMSPVRENATFVTLARNEDLWSLVGSIREVEDRFNHQYHYDWVFLNDKEFSDEFKRVTSSFVSGETKYALIPPEHWGYPDFIDQNKAAEARAEMTRKNIIYGFSESYRHMCRFESGFFWRNPALDKYKYYWRVEPHIKLTCNIDFDPFTYMRENDKKYAFTISLFEYPATIETLWATVKDFMRQKPEYLHPNNALRFISDDGGENYNNCHFWSNFEIGDLDFYRSDAYRAFFDHLDHAGGFFYERWGDAPVHSIAASLLLDKNQVHYFEDIGYWHVPFQNCPVDEATRMRLKCTCPKDDSLADDQRHIFTFKGYSCTKKWYEINNRMLPPGYEKHL